MSHDNESHDKVLSLTLRVWRQPTRLAKGEFKEYKVANISVGSSFLEMIDILNEQLVASNEEPIAFDHDCREGICGMCSMTINGIPHGPLQGVTTCQVHMRHFKDGETITLEPWRARPFPVIKDLVVDRTALDRVTQAGGFISIRTGSAIDANIIPIPKPVADRAMDAAECIGCGACVAACPNAAAMLFVGSKVAHFNSLPQGKAEKDQRTLAMVRTMDAEGFGNCTNYGECQAVCPKGNTLDFIAQLNRDYASAQFKNFFRSTGKQRVMGK
ncbi:MAG: succinate dehydrogenase/fumarate reductase iron-sulfur subunit [Puniceicoccales bacterium]|jgi:succinate dehydrogenase / fumarate reductase iron-sulfur subunit|nr:succinate dehydrogenase/fumarate reductase iron-sulfur subunit [Puniceicoccales bacterium]